MLLDRYILHRSSMYGEYVEGILGDRTNQLYA